MTYEKMTGMIELEELEVQAEDVVEVPGGLLVSRGPRMYFADPEHPCPRE